MVLGSPFSSPIPEQAGDHHTLCLCDHQMGLNKHTHPGKPAWLEELSPGGRSAHPSICLMQHSAEGVLSHNEAMGLHLDKPIHLAPSLLIQTGAWHTETHSRSSAGSGQVITAKISSD